MKIVVVVVAAIQVAAVGLFAVFALSGDSWGIARAMAMLLGLPFLAFTVPALILMRKGYLTLAASVAVASLIATALAWRFA